MRAHSLSLCIALCGACASSPEGFVPGGDGGTDGDATAPVDAPATDSPASPETGAADDAASDASSTDAQTVGADGGFVPSTDTRDRIGVYAWGFDDSSWPGTPDRLNWAASKVSGLGGRTIRVYLGPQDIYRVLPGVPEGGTFDLATAATSTAYAALFSSPSFDTYLLTTYSAGDDADNWTDGYTQTEAATETQEITALGTALLQSYPGKTFILLDWEGDNAIAPYVGSASAWTGFTAWTQARAAGVVAARQAAGATTSRLYSGVEFNLLRNLSNGDACDQSANQCIVSVVVPQVDVDFYSYSSWQSLAPDQTPAQVAAQLQADLTTALGWARKRDPSIPASRFIVGEFGAPREESDLGECAATSRTAGVVSAVTGWGAAFGIFWQIIDNTPSTQPNDFVDGFGLYKASGAASLSAGLFQALYQTQVPTVPMAPSCPTINQGGVVDGTDFKSDDIDASTTISIFGQAFTTTGDVVHVRQTGMQWDIADGSPYFYESSGQINATLPGVYAGQNALVYVTNGDGMDTNGQIVPIQP